MDGNCQVSSTLYNVVLQIPELEVKERHAHIKPVHYVEKDKDATVAYGSVDFKFKNILNKTIYVFMRMENGYIECIIVGDEYRQLTRKIDFNSYQDKNGVWHLMKTIDDTQNNLHSQIEINTSIYE